MSKLWEMVKDREAWRAAVFGVTKRGTERLNSNDFYQNGPVCSSLWWNFPRRAPALTLQTNQLILMRLMFGWLVQGAPSQSDCLFVKCAYGYI